MQADEPEMNKRKHIPQDDETSVLVRSGRRCCLCFGLFQDATTKRGQIAHLDQNPANSTLDNLAFLCFAHHDEYDSRTAQSKGLTNAEVGSVIQFSRFALDHVSHHHG